MSKRPRAESSPLKVRPPWDKYPVFIEPPVGGKFDKIEIPVVDTCSVFRPNLRCGHMEAFVRAVNAVYGENVCDFSVTYAGNYIDYPWNIRFIAIVQDAIESRFAEMITRDAYERHQVERGYRYDSFVEFADFEKPGWFLDIPTVSKYLERAGTCQHELGAEKEVREKEVKRMLKDGIPAETMAKIRAELKAEMIARLWYGGEKNP